MIFRLKMKKLFNVHWHLIIVLAGSCIPGLSIEYIYAQQKEIPVSESNVIILDEQTTPPDWALMERFVLDKLYPAALEFVEKYTRKDGTLLWREEWPGMDGSDDGYESFYNFPLYYVLGGPKPMDALSRKLWKAVTRQFTEYGQIYKDFDAHYDWMHHGESYTNYYFFGLADPNNEEFKQRALYFAGLYMGEDSAVSNYDPDLKLIRSPINGSKGPHFQNTAEDWVTHRPILAHYPLPFNDIPHVDSSEAWNDDEKFPYILETMNKRMMRGDVPLNMTSTSMILNAFMYTGEEKYKNWILEYVDAWIERTKKNNGILPDNVGLSGKIGEYMDGNWWGGYYGWRWPHGLFNLLESSVIGASNAFLISGKSEYLDLPRSVLRAVEKQGKEEDDKFLVPHRHGDNGWYDYRVPNPKHSVHLWYMSRHDADWQRVSKITDEKDWQQLDYHKGKGDSENLVPWLGFLDGKNPDYPMEILKACYNETLKRLDAIRKDETTPDQQDVHHWQRLNPIVLEGLVQCTLGAPNHIYHGGLLHASVRYFDPSENRPGLPTDVAALVDSIRPTGITLKLINLNPNHSKDLIVQAGMFGEHTFTRVRQVLKYPYQFHTINNNYITVRLNPGTGGQLELDMNRFQNQPTYEFPWKSE